MCISFKNKWTKFEPTKQYLSIVSGLTTVDKLHKFIQKFQFTGESGKDVWQTPEQFLQNLELDCDDFMRFNTDVLKRVMKIDARGVIHSGYNKKVLGDKLQHHAICIFPHQGKLAVFSNTLLYKGINSFEDAGKILFVDGLKYQIVRDWQGKVLSKKRKWIGVY